MFHPAIVLKAARIVLFHNHPSGDPTPSQEDVTLTRRLVEIGRLMGIDVVDHIIVGDGTYHSMKSDSSAGW